ncbi:MAG: hypothetical protein WAW36_12590 [Methylovulum miyakonense]|uniref:hypothetical protein n=1 Tax=Methylovulum miyakonense TaxID=645578 RepID=UPI003BB506F9
MSKRLIKKLDLSIRGELSDEFMAIAYTIEESLISAGAEPGKDYNILDLYRLAQPFALEIFKSNENIKYFYASTNVE